MKESSSATVSKRQSTRLTKTISSNESSQVNSPLRAQTRITSFVSARKRPVEPSTIVGAKKEPLQTSAPSTPVKIKKRTISTKDQSEKENTLPQEKTGEQSVLTLEPVVEPAYKRFAHLVKDVPTPEVVTVKQNYSASISETDVKTAAPNEFEYLPWLPLHERFGIYEKIVFNVDSLCMLSAGRSLPCVFHKIQKTLEGTIGKNVPIDYLERIKTVWPEAFEYSAMKIIMQGKRMDSVSIAVPGLADTDSSAALLNDRKENIKARVQNFVIQAHNQFVSEKFNRPVPVNAVLKQWHPEFNQESIPDIARTELLTNKVIEEVPTAIPKSIASIVSTPTKSTSASLPASPSVVEPAAAPSVKLSLLERIRAKEQKMISDRMFGNDPERARELALLSQLEKFCQSVMLSFAADKKTTMFLTDLTNRLILSSPIPISPAEVLERLKLLQKVMPNWVRVKDEPPSPRTVKLLDKNFSLQQIIDCLGKYQQNLRTTPKST